MLGVEVRRLQSFMVKPVTDSKLIETIHAMMQHPGTIEQCEPSSIAGPATTQTRYLAALRFPKSAVSAGYRRGAAGVGSRFRLPCPSSTMRN